LPISFLSSPPQILLSYLQLVSIAKGIQLQWPGSIAKLFGATGQATSSTGGFVSLDCSLEANSVPKSIQKALISIFLPCKRPPHVLQVALYMESSCSDV
jgi:hypothetical protein